MTSNSSIPRHTPESQGISSTGILAFLTEADTNIHDMHSFMLLRHGAVVAEGWWSPFKPEYPHMLFSLSKSFTSTAIGMVIAEGRLSEEDFVLSFFPKEAPRKVSKNLAVMRIKHLLSMTTGHGEDTLPFLVSRKDENWIKAFLMRPVEYEPGTHFLYNTGATFMLSAILQKVTGERLLDYLTPRLLVPLGIRDASWERGSGGINLGGWGLNIKTEDIARFGQFYLQKGVWEGKRLLPEAWLEKATSFQVSNGSKADSDWEQGYGYQFWRCRFNAYRADGAFGQYCVVIPEQDAVLAVTAGLGEMQPLLNLVWKHLLPAMHPTPLPEDEPAHAKVQQKCSSLALIPCQGVNSTPLAGKISGKTFILEANVQKYERVSLDFGRDSVLLTVRNQAGQHRLECGLGKWVEGTTGLMNKDYQKVFASAAWINENTFEAKLYFVETPFCFRLTFHCEEDRLVLESGQNVNFGPTEFPPVVGRLQPES